METPTNLSAARTSAPTNFFCDSQKPFPAGSVVKITGTAVDVCLEAGATKEIP